MSVTLQFVATVRSSAAETPFVEKGHYLSHGIDMSRIDSLQTNKDCNEQNTYSSNNTHFNDVLLKTIFVATTIAVILNVHLFAIGIYSQKVGSIFGFT